MNFELYQSMQLCAKKFFHVFQTIIIRKNTSENLKKSVQLHTNPLSNYKLEVSYYNYTLHLSPTLKPTNLIEIIAMECKSIYI